MLDSNRNIPIGRSEYLPGSQLSAMSQHQPSQYMQPMPAVYMAPHPNQMDMQSNAATIQAFQFEFMKRMFEEMKELMKTNRMLDQQMLQEAVLKNMNLTLTAGTQMPQYQAPTTPQTREQPIQSFPQVPPIGTQQTHSKCNLNHNTPTLVPIHHRCLFRVLNSSSRVLKLTNINFPTSAPI